MAKAKKEDLTALSNAHSVYNPETKEYDLIDLMTGEVISSGALSTQLGKYIFSFDYAVAICQEIRKGATLTDLGGMSGYPPLEVIHMWIRMHPEFKAHVDIAKKDRAENYHDKIISLAEALANPDDEVAAATVASKKTAIDAYKWAAEKGDPDRFGKKQEVSHVDTRPTTIVISTGINRQSAPIEDVEFTEVKKDE